MSNFKGPEIAALKLLLPGHCPDRELIIPPEVVSSIILPAVEHEIGHIVAAAHFGAVIIGIGLGFIPQITIDGILFQAIYGWEDCPMETQCIVKAAGPAADLLYRGRIDEGGAKGDLDDIEALSGVRALEPYLTRATELLAGYQSEIAWIAERLRAALSDGQCRRMVPLPNGQMVALFMDETKLRECP